MWDGLKPVLPYSPEVRPAASDVASMALSCSSRISVADCGAEDLYETRTTWPLLKSLTSIFFFDAANAVFLSALNRVFESSEKRRSLGGSDRGSSSTMINPFSTSISRIQPLSSFVTSKFAFGPPIEPLPCASTVLAANSIMKTNHKRLIIV